MNGSSVNQKFLDQRKQARLQYLQGLSQVNADYSNSVRWETNAHFRNRRECLKGGINGLETNSENKNIRDLVRGIN